MRAVAAIAAAFATTEARRVGEVWGKEQTEKAGIVWRGNLTKTPLPHETLRSEDVPAEFSWCDNNGVNYCTESRNQHIPQYCGSCWAHGAVSALADRIKIAKKGKGIDINLAVQHMLNCGTAGSCHGGSIDGPYQWIQSISQSTGTGIAFETEQPYQACSSESTEGFCGAADWTCTNINKARTCPTFGEECVALDHYPNATVSEYGSISGADAMQKEILARGPISCGIDAAPILNYTGGISSLAGEGVDHVVSVVGWGKEGSTSYWIVRNSWGQYWGEFGYIRVEMGNNALHLEEQCSWAVPGAFTTKNYPCHEGGDNCEAGVAKLPETPTKKNRKSELLSEEDVLALGIVPRGNFTKTALPHETVKDADLPDSFTWCNKDGVNYCTQSRNQHIPQYCGSCWAHGAISALGDRIKIARGGNKKGYDINLAVQHMLNCGTAGSCHGGSVDGPYQWIHSISQKTGSGISYETAMPYSACSSESREGFCAKADWSCKAINVARTCSTFTENGGKCAALKRYPNATVSEYGSISGASAMQKEIYARGPISCGVNAVPIEDYTGGIVTGHRFGGTDHVISVVGWGNDATVGKYWIVRNSWGEYWGESGYFRVEMGKNSLSIESGCSWAVPGAFTDHDNFPCFEGGENC